MAEALRLNSSVSVAQLADIRWSGENTSAGKCLVRYKFYMSILIRTKLILEQCLIT